MNISYDYTDLLNELKDDLHEGLIKPNDYIKIVRGDERNGYRPIIDFYYNDDTPEEEYEELTVATIVVEMDRYNKLI